MRPKKQRNISHTTDSFFILNTMHCLNRGQCNHQCVGLTKICTSDYPLASQSYSQALLDS